MYLENQRTGESAPVDMSRITINSSRTLHIGTYDVTNRGSDNYRVLVVKISAPALYVEEQFIDIDDHAYGKASAEPALGYEVDLSAISGQGAMSVSVYPNPASDEIFIALPRVSRQEELSAKCLQLVITNAIGEDVMHLQSLGGQTLKISTARLSAGMYNAYVLDSNITTQSV